jgi:MoaA/NifB/PqqE/SkfB family radical SAM enzyme
MCKTYSRTNEYKELNEIQISVLIDLFKYLETIIYIGGEPLIYKNIETLFDVANKFNVKQEMITNGLLLTKEIIRKIVDYDIKLTLSIDSVDKNIYENIRVGGNFNTLLKNVEYIYEYRCLKHSKNDFAINTVLSRWNIEYEDNFIEIIKFAKKYCFTTINIYCDNNESNKDLQKKYVEKFNLQRDILIELANKYDINLNIYFGSLNKSIDKDKVDCKFCFFPWRKLPWSKMYIKFNGIVNIDRRCPNIGDFSENITREYLINDIWNGQKMLVFRKKIINDDLKNIKEECCSNNSLIKG